MEIFIIFALISSFTTGFFSQTLAEIKGYPKSKFQNKFYWIGFWFNVVGLLFVIALPDCRKQK